MNHEITKTLHILHFNDAYDIEKTPAFAQQFLAYDNPLSFRFFSGDIFSPSTVSIFEKGKQFIPFLNKLRLHGSMVGNHDVDFGEEVFMELAAKLNFPWLVCNLKRKKDNRNLGLCPGYEIIEANGLKIGIFGLLDQAWMEASNLTMKHYILLDFLKEARTVSKKLRSAGCDFVIALTHMANRDDELLLDDPESDVDLILGGHEHFFLILQRNGKILLKSGSNFDNFSSIFLTRTNAPMEKIDTISYESSICSQFINENNNIRKKNNIEVKVKDLYSKHSDGLSYLMTPKNSDENYFRFCFPQKTTKTNLIGFIEKVNIDQNGPKDLELEKYSKSVFQELNKKTQFPMAKLKGDLDLTGRIIRSKGSRMADIIGDLARIKSEADSVLVQSGHLRSEQAYKDGHILTMLDVLKILPIKDHFIKLEVTGAELISIIEQGLQFHPNNVGSFPNFSGLRILFDPSKPAYHRISPENVTIHGKAIDLEAQYIFSILSFLSIGKDGYTLFPNLKRGPVGKEVYTISALTEFLELPKEKNNRDEFVLFKSLQKEIDFEEVVQLSRQKTEKGKYEHLTKEALDAERGNLRKAIGQMSKEGLMRLAMYYLAEEIVVEDGAHVFVLDSRSDGRLEPLEV